MRKGLFIGINDYDWSPLKGCANDAIGLATILMKNADGAQNMECQVLISDEKVDHSSSDEFFGPRNFFNGKLPQSKMLKHIRQLFNNQGDLALLFFSGHGHQNDLGGYLVSTNAIEHDEGVSLNDVINLANNATKVREIIIFLDCCHAGHAGQSPLIGDNTTRLREGVSIITASLADQLARERDNAGIFSSILIDGLSGSAGDITGRVTVGSLYILADQLLGAFEQRPTFKSNLTTLTTLRKAKPQLPLRIINKIPELFIEKDTKIKLDPGYEPTADPRDKNKERDFAILQKLVAANLVYPVGAKHMYYAAMNYKYCRLNKRGEIYWKLVKNNQV